MYNKIYYDSNKAKFQNAYQRYKTSHLTLCEVCQKNYFKIDVHNASKKHLNNMNKLDDVQPKE